MNEVVDLVFVVSATQEFDADHRYHLFSAVSEIVSELHGGGGFAVHSLTGKQTKPGKLILNERSRLIIRSPVDAVGALLPLVGKPLRIGGTTLQVGTPEIRKLVPSVTLRSALVTIKRSDKKVDAESFIESARKQLSALGISASVEIELPQRKSHAGELRSAQRTFCIKGREIIGFEVRLHNLTADESVLVQSLGIGGRRAMGCGLFKPFHPSDVHPGSRNSALEASNA